MKKMQKVALFLCCMLGASCAKKTADLELDLARQAMADAQSRRASKCAKETYLAAEAAIAEAERLAEDGDIKAAKAKAMEGKSLAEQASAASPAGCDKPKVAEPQDDPDPDLNNQDANATNAATLARLESVLETIYFDYNDATIRQDGKQVLSKVAGLMNQDGGTQIEIEGHCDIRGSTEYNLHLGERRARSVMKYLTTQGVATKQISIISYGEERPVDLGIGDTAHQRNRRAELRKR